MGGWVCLPISQLRQNQQNHSQNKKLVNHHHLDTPHAHALAPVQASLENEEREVKPRPASPLQAHPEPFHPQSLQADVQRPPKKAAKKQRSHSSGGASGKRKGSSSVSSKQSKADSRARADSGSSSGDIKSKVTSSAKAGGGIDSSQGGRRGSSSSTRSASGGGSSSSLADPPKLIRSRARHDSATLSGVFGCSAAEAVQFFSQSGNSAGVIRFAFSISFLFVRPTLTLAGGFVTSTSQPCDDVRSKTARPLYNFEQLYKNTG
jgi:hypothetical protein